MGFPCCHNSEDLFIDVSITNVGLILTKPGWFLFSGYGHTDMVLASSYGNMSAHKKFINSKLKIRSYLSIAICIPGGRGCVTAVKFHHRVLQLTLVFLTIWQLLGVKFLLLAMVPFIENKNLKFFNLFDKLIILKWNLIELPHYGRKKLLHRFNFLPKITI